MPFWRRDDETLNERLAREAGLSLSGDEPEASAEPEPEPDRDESLRAFRNITQPVSDLVAIHGVHRAREWDAVATAEAAGIQGDAVHFVALPDGALVVDEEVPGQALDRLADALDPLLTAPYRAEAVRRGGDTWAIGARRVELVELPAEVEGDEIELAVNDGERVLTIDGRESERRLLALEQLAQKLGGSYVARAARLDERLWEVELFPL